MSIPSPEQRLANEQAFMGLYNRGKEVHMRGRRVADMSRDEVIAAVGELDEHLACMAERASRCTCNERS